MKYEKQIDEILRMAFYKEWMDDEDYNEFIELLSIDKQLLSDKMEEGVKNGYSIGFQTILLTKLIRQIENEL